MPIAKFVDKGGLLDSPRHAIGDSSLERIRQDLDAFGHVVLEGLWGRAFPGQLFERARQRFEEDDARYRNGVIPGEEPRYRNYLAGFTDLESLIDTRSEKGASLSRDLVRDFFDVIDLSGLPGVLRHLLHGSFVVGTSERVIRRVDPTAPGRFVGLHADGQLGPCSRHGIRTKRELTIWSPLVDCTDEDTPRLLLLHRGQRYEDLFPRDELRFVGDSEYLPIQLHPAPETRRADDRENLETVHAMYEHVFRKRRCYAPRVALGDAVVFDHDIMHGSYLGRGMHKVRYSLDFRVVGEYEVCEENQDYSGRLYEQLDFPVAGTRWRPVVAPPVPPPPPRPTTRQLAMEILERTVPLWIRPRRQLRRLISFLRRPPGR